MGYIVRKLGTYNANDLIANLTLPEDITGRVKLRLALEDNPDIFTEIEVNIVPPTKTTFNDFNEIPKGYTKEPTNANIVPYEYLRGYKALQFDGSGYLRSLIDGNYSFESNTPFKISFKFKVDNTPIVDDGLGIISLFSDTLSNYIDVSCNHNDLDVLIKSNNRNEESFSLPYQTEKWYQMVIAFDGSNLSIYLNDELKSSIIYKSDFPMQRIKIGQSKEDMQNFIGLFDELSIIKNWTGK